MTENTPAPARDNSALYIPAAIVVAGLIIGLSLVLALKPSNGSVGTATGGQVAAVDIKDVKIAGDPFIGNANAKIVLAYWSDYQCPFCKQFELQTLPEIIKSYVDTGKVKIVFKDYPFLGEDSITAAEYEHAIWELFPAKYWAWREAMYNAQDDEGDQGFGDAASIDTLTGKIDGINLAAVKAAVAKNKAAYDSAIDADRAEGTNFGVQGTPGFITGKTLIPGAVPLAQFKTAIDAQL
ncbi:thioredoxin domain-containing protein [Candidatus Kaiserbacteria bacterium]|nr:thioredoxin domain-containing protein [Candidatus Kaiserbacteria bacterium]